MKETRKFVDTNFSSFLKPYSFKKKGSNWALKKEQFLITIWPQKSQWSDIFYINIGIQFENLDERLPKAHNGDIKFRLVDFSREKSRDNFTLDIQSALVQKLLKEQVIDVFLPLETKEDIIKLLEHPPRSYIVSLSAKKILGLPYEEPVKGKIDITVRKWNAE